MRENNKGNILIKASNEPRQCYGYGHTMSETKKKLFKKSSPKNCDVIEADNNTKPITTGSLTRI